MPDLTITLTDAQLQRVLSSRIYDTQDDKGERVPATRMSIESKLRRYIRDDVRRAELNKVTRTAEAAKRSEMEAEGW